MTGRSAVSALLREARARASLSQQALADRAHTAQSVVGRIEAGLASPTVETLTRLLDAAGFSLSIEIIPKPNEDPVTNAYKRDVDQTLLIENLRKTPDQRIRALIAMQRFHTNLRDAMQVATRVAERPPTAAGSKPQAR